ncbi:glycosyltransferase family 2 protein [Yersinia ruckeri]|uniref:glycosyltransferase family 2 protein n=1 Tax=Yersinia ruckeri TaxID=29486 RepID=UPI000907AC54|nr:glycosyltransferase family 2 protein [Yersinia ruckeri]AUQ40667.1 glycosyltransferase family 2 protein [Yersinia ruckeri]EKN4704103.1 glycosyltransferase family 2 protein [Yersinia ruckeri]UIN06607.1 glycosyltransferase family 2 protein [Yersinia ruckeri]WMS05459.1 glycosyltransferase family 2 protein [Yersinia ruckeri]
MKSMVLIENKEKDDFVLTIAIPTYKRYPLLKETLRSVFSLKFNILVEVIIVDNDPDSSEIALLEMNEFSNYNFTYYKNIKNYPMFENWNQCLKLGKGKFITILHDDDLLCQNFSTAIEEYLAMFPDYVNVPLIGFDAYILDQRIESNKVKQKFLYKVVRSGFYMIKSLISYKSTSEMRMNDFFWGPRCKATLGIVMDREKALAISGFDVTWYPISDYEFWTRWIKNYGAIIYSSKKVGFYRYLDNLSLNPDTINGVINKNHELRLKMISNGDIPKCFTNVVDLVKLNDEYISMVSYGGRDSFKMTTKNVMFFFLLKIKYIFYKFIYKNR